MSITSKSWSLPNVVLGGWTSTACCATEQTETLGFQPTMVIVFVNTSGTNPNVYIKHATETDENLLITGSSGVITSPADAGGIELTSTGFTVDETAQTASGVNFYIAVR